MQQDERDPLWDLLGKAKKPEVSPYFARNVVRAIREMEFGRSGAFSRLASRLAFLRGNFRAASLAFAACALLAGGYLFSVNFRVPEEGLVSASSDIVSARSDEPAPLPADIEIVADLDLLLAYEETTAWLGDDF